MSDSGAPATVSVCSMINCTLGKCAMEPITSRLAATIQHTTSSTSARRRRQNRTNLHFREPSAGRGGWNIFLVVPKYLLSGFEGRKTLGRRVSLRCSALDKRSWWSWRCSPPQTMGAAQHNQPLPGHSMPAGYNNATHTRPTSHSGARGGESLA